MNKDIVTKCYTDQLKKLVKKGGKSIIITEQKKNRKFNRKKLTSSYSFGENSTDY
jgi:hypothetical protein